MRGKKEGVSFSSKSKAIVFPKHILKSKERDQSIQASKKFSRNSKELFVQRFVKVFDQNRKHVEAVNHRIGRAADLTVLW